MDTDTLHRTSGILPSAADGRCSQMGRRRYEASQQAYAYTRLGTGALIDSRRDSVLSQLDSPLLPLSVLYLKYGIASRSYPECCSLLESALNNELAQS